MTLLENGYIKNVWESLAERYGNSHCVSWGDHYAIDLEVDLINKFVNEGDLILDAGCSNGHATLRQLNKNPGKLFGVDFSEKMIAEAVKNQKEKKIDSKQAEFMTGDILDLQFKDHFFNITYTTRVLINLPNWESQKRGIKELVRVTKKGGKVILLEAFWEPLVILNSLRAIVKLSPLEEHDFNRYLKKSKLEKFLKDENLSFYNIDFSSLYYLGSRLVRELVTDIDKYEGYSNPVNGIFYELEKEFSGGGFGIQQAYIIEL
jgi:ubiquinone/menaquinone biosynthesis C-methylase UbiE